MNGHWTGQAVTTTEIHYIVTPRYRSENSRLNTVFRVGLHSVHKQFLGRVDFNAVPLTERRHAGAAAARG